MKSRLDRKIQEKEFILKPDDSIIICRCEEITRGEIRKAIYDGMMAMNEIRRCLRAGMGLCQGQTCGRLVQAILATELGVRPDEVEAPISRAPARPVLMETYALEQCEK